MHAAGAISVVSKFGSVSMSAVTYATVSSVQVEAGDLDVAVANVCVVFIRSFVCSFGFLHHQPTHSFLLLYLCSVFAVCSVQWC